MKPRQKVRAVLQKYQRLPNAKPGLLGNGAGLVDDTHNPGHSYVRIANAPALSVVNKRCASIDNLPVWIGYDPLEPTTLQVLSIRSYQRYGVGGLDQSPQVGAHATTHRWMERDTVFVDLRQMMPFRPMVNGTMNLQINQGITFLGGQWQGIGIANIDMTPYIPATGAVMSLVYYGDSGTYVEVGTVKDLDHLSVRDAPVPTAGTVPVALIRLWSGMSGIVESRIATDLADPRWTGLYGGTGGGTGTSSTDEKVKISSGDTTANYLENKIVAGSNIYFTKNNAGANETLTILSSGTSYSLEVKEEDGTPDVTGVVQIKVPNGSLTNNGGGSVSISFTGSSGTSSEIVSEGSFDLAYPAIPTTTTITTDGYATNDTNGIIHCYDQIVSFRMGDQVYQAVGYWDAAGHLNIATRTIPGDWTNYDFGATIAIGSADDHKTISLGIDPYGYIHVGYGMHGVALLYRKSTLPINTFNGNLTTTLSMVGTNETSVTYPTFFNDPSGILYFMFRAGLATNGSIYFYEYDHVATTWAAATGTGTAGLLVQGGTNLSSYWGKPNFDPDFGSGGKMHFTFMWYDFAAGQFIDLDYAAWNGTTWEHANGTAQAVPITRSNDETVDNGEGSYSGYYRITQLNAVYADSTGHPHLAYGKVGADDYEHLYHAWYDGSTWIKMALTTETLDPDTQNIWPLMVVDRRDDTVRIIYRNPLDVDDNDGLLMLVNTLADFTAWKKQVLYAGDLGDFSTASYSMPKLDYYQWEHYHRLSISMAPFETGQSSLPIYLLEYSPRAWAAVWDADDYPTLHTNDADTATGIHHTLGTGANQAAAGNHNHTGVYSPVGHTHDDRYYTEAEVDALLAAFVPPVSSGELLMQDGVTAPPVPIENEAQDDWLYYG